MFYMAKLYRKKPRFFRADLEMLRAYFLKTPYHLSSGNVPFGETPLNVIEQMAKAFRWRKSDKLLELGSGTGRVGFWLNISRGISVRGIDHSEAFIRRAKRITERLGLKGLSFEKGDLLDADFSWPSIVYFYATAFPEDLISRLTEKLSLLPAGAQVITISEPLNKSPHFYLYKRLEVHFPWGRAWAFCYRKK